LNNFFTDAVLEGLGTPESEYFLTLDGRGTPSRSNVESVFSIHVEFLYKGNILLLS